MRLTFRVLKRMERASLKTSSPCLFGFKSAATFTGPVCTQVSPAAPGSEKKSPLARRSVKEREKSERYRLTPETLGSSNSSILMVSLKIRPDAGISPTRRLSALAGSTALVKTAAIKPSAASHDIGRASDCCGSAAPAPLVLQGVAACALPRRTCCSLEASLLGEAKAELPQQVARATRAVERARDRSRERARTAMMSHTPRGLAGWDARAWE
mmetsp:Transcript_62549/g.161090  ORF Transcript_62549/g.161090 Transcript_62549/m.161090 type:complete len:213 (-) Transcript_62549:21-659(-)